LVNSKFNTHTIETFFSLNRHFTALALLTSFVFPICVYYYICGETFTMAWHINMIRYVSQINLTWGINSFAHFYGDKPYDKNISPIDSRTFSLMSLGEGWHNYHHVFPWDYSGSEFPGRALNFSKSFIEFFAWLGWATELKTVSKTLIHKRVLRTGDGSHPYSKEMMKNKKSIEYHDDILKDNEHFWGFGKLPIYSINVF
jgi:stearoyl-CoA desaturase (Delta-9 desaturase)